MEGGVGGQQQQQGSSSLKPSKFSVYQNPVLSAALTSSSLRPSPFTLFFIISLFFASFFALLISFRRGETVINSGFIYVSRDVARLCSKLIQITALLVFLGALLAFVKAISWWNRTSVEVLAASGGTKESKRLTNRQLGLLGLRQEAEAVSEESSKKDSATKIPSYSASNVLIPLHQPLNGLNHGSRMSAGKSTSSSGAKMPTFVPASKSSPSMYLVPSASVHSPASVQSPSLHTSSGADQFVASPWSNKRSTFSKEIVTEEDLENFLADVDEKMFETASKLATPPPSITAFGMAGPNTLTSSVNTSGTTRSTPLRPVRMSPSSQKFSTSPKKGEGDLLPPMSMEESIEAFERFGIYPQIELWRDRLRQWFSAVLLNPLLSKIDNSHLKVMDSAAKLGIVITVNQVGSDVSSTPTSANLSPVERKNEWKPAYAVEEDGLHQLRATLVQALDASKLPPSNFLSTQQNAYVPLLQEAIDAITEHQRLHALMKGEWSKGLLPQSNLRADYTIQRIRELAEGTCLRNYECLGNQEVYNKVSSKWRVEIPCDSHLLLYLFCAFLEHPKWMLHVDPTAYAGTQSSKNPLFLGVLPPKESFPEKYIAIVPGIPPVLHPGACVLVVGKQSPPVFALYWNKKPQFSLQGRTALWDSILLLCSKIKTSYGGIVRGMHLGSSALAILPVLEEELDD